MTADLVHARGRRADAAALPLAAPPPRASSRDGVLGAGELELLRTRYLDFSGEPAWSAVREPAL